jgi:UDP-N-acetylglucosamine 2-epimerase (non-hydrolysing)
MLKPLLIVAARPNFMKVAPLHRAFQKSGGIQSRIVHTGQHYDAKMSEVFFEQLELPVPDYYLGVGGGSHTQQTARIMLEFEKVVDAERPDLVVVVGDVNSTIACALVAAKAQIPVAHVEAGLRSGDRSMPEEINRILTDALSEHLFVTEQSGMDNLAKEGVPGHKTQLVGNCMIDALVSYRDKAAATLQTQSMGLAPKSFVVCTMHRPSNVDSMEGLSTLVRMLEKCAAHTALVLPLHPRTRQNLERFGLMSRLSALPGLHLVEPLGYLEFLNLLDNCSAVLTDSGGIQEETTYLQVPCITFRNSTERPVTVELGSNCLVGDLDPDHALDLLQAACTGRWKSSTVPPLWDGHAAERIAALLLR